MDRRSPALGPEVDENPGPANDAGIESIDPATAEPIRKSLANPRLPAPAAEPLDPEHVRLIRKSLDDPRPNIPAEEAFARVDARIAEYKAKRGL